MEIQADLGLFQYEALQKLMEKTLPGLVAASVHGVGMLAAARVVRDEARRTTAFTDDTGNLRKSIAARARTDTINGKRIPRGAAQVVAGGSGAHQAYIIEFGRIAGPGYAGAPARPFIEPALYGTRGKQLSESGRAMSREFEKVARGLARRQSTGRIRRLSAL